VARRSKSAPRIAPPSRPDHAAKRFKGRRGPEAKIDLASEGVESPTWQAIPQSADDPHPVLWVRQRGELDLEARATLELQGIADVHSETGSLETALTPKYFALLASQIPTGVRLLICHHFARENRTDPAVRVTIQVRCEANHYELLIANARKAVDELWIALQASQGRLRFDVSRRPPDSETAPAKFQYRLQSAGLNLHTPERRTPGYLVNDGKRGDSGLVRLPFPGRQGPVACSALIMMASLSRPVTVAMSIRSRMVDESNLRTLKSALEAVRDGAELSVGSSYALVQPSALPAPLREALLGICDSWLRQPGGYELALEIHSDQPVASVALRTLASDFWRDRPVTVQEIGTSPESGKDFRLDLSQALHPEEIIPPVFAEVDTLRACGIPVVYTNPPVRLPTAGTHIGTLSGSTRPVFLGKVDRDRHVYIVGASGTGKSTLLSSMIRQDLDSGRGLALMDPHGDLFEHVMDLVPAKRRNDVVVIDPTNGEHAVGMNFLELRSGAQGLERNFIINSLLEIVSTLYDLRVSGGPGFEQYMRGSLMLLMAEPGNTLLDLQRVFVDRTFRNQLIEKVTDPLTKQFWRMAKEVTGDHALANWGPYVTSKFQQFTSNELLRTMIGQPRSTIDFRDAMDRSKVLLIRISKGIIGNVDARFLGMLFLAKLQAAALSRAGADKASRVPFSIYLDEFQNFTTPSISTILAEGRKYGLSLVLAHQTLAQLDGAMRDTIMGNVANKILFRVGDEDAVFLSRLVQPQLTSTTLLSLPDYHFAGRLLARNQPLPPLIVRATPPPLASSNETLRSGIMDRSLKQYARPIAEVNAEIMRKLQSAE
jgi:ABC-type uncharacterized transport system YnjBCD ATPase subunit